MPKGLRRRDTPKHSHPRVPHRMMQHIRNKQYHFRWGKPVFATCSNKEWPLCEHHAERPLQSEAGGSDHPCKMESSYTSRRQCASLHSALGAQDALTFVAGAMGCAQARCPCDRVLGPSICSPARAMSFGMHHTLPLHLLNKACDPLLQGLGQQDDLLVESHKLDPSVEVLLAQCGRRSALQAWAGTPQHVLQGPISALQESGSEVRSAVRVGASNLRRAPCTCPGRARPPPLATRCIESERPLLSA